MLARVTELLPDAKGLVRRVKVKFRKRNSREARMKCKPKMIEEIIAVQRLCLLEPSPRGDPSPSTPPPSCPPTSGSPSTSSESLVSQVPNLLSH